MWDDRLDELRVCWFLARELRNKLKELKTAYGVTESDHLMTSISDDMRAVCFKAWCESGGFKDRVARVTVEPGVEP